MFKKQEYRGEYQLNTAQIIMISANFPLHRTGNIPNQISERSEPFASKRRSHNY